MTLFHRLDRDARRGPGPLNIGSIVAAPQAKPNQAVPQADGTGSTNLYFTMVSSTNVPMFLGYSAAIKNSPGAMIGAPKMTRNVLTATIGSGNELKQIVLFAGAIGKAKTVHQWRSTCMLKDTKRFDVE